MGIIRYSSFGLLLLLLIVPSVFGAGFAYDGLGVKARGMGGAFRAIADDWSAAYYNPAGYNRIADNSISGNLDLFHNRYEIIPNVAIGDYYYTNDKEVYNKHEVLNVPQGSIQFRLPAFNETAFGFSIMQLYDQNQMWDLYYHSPEYNDSILPPTKQFVNDLDVVAFQLTMAKGFMEDQLSVGIGLSILRGDLYFNDMVLRENPFGDNDDNINAINNEPYEVIPEYYSNDGSGWGFGYKLGLLYEVSDKLDVALVINGPSSIDLSGTTKLTFFLGQNDETTLLPGTEENYFLDGNVDDLTADFDATLELPASVGVGLAYKVNDKLTLAIDAEYTMWSTFEGFEFKFSNMEGFADSTYTHLNDMYATDMSTPVDWEDGGRLMIGGNYKLNGYAELRGGFGIDQTIVSAETFVPQFIDLATKYTYSFGAGFEIENWNVDLAISYTHQADLTSANYSSDFDDDGLLDNIAGDYRADNYHTVLGISYRF